jgi:hypothetical protein
MSSKAQVEFDLDRYLRNSKKVDLSKIDWDEIPNHSLSDGDVMCLHYMMDIEAHTVIYLRDLLATRAAADPQITAFLPCWVYSSPLPSRSNRWRDLRVSIGVGNGLGIGPTMLGSALARDFVAIHMMWGAVNELTTLTGYYALIRRSDHPVLASAPAQGHPGRAPPLRVLPRPGQGAHAAIALRSQDGALGTEEPLRRSARA